MCWTVICCWRLSVRSLMWFCVWVSRSGFTWTGVTSDSVVSSTVRIVTFAPAASLSSNPSPGTPTARGRSSRYGDDTQWISDPPASLYAIFRSISLTFFFFPSFPLMQETIYKNYFSIQLKPEQFSSFLTSEVGFSSYELLGTPNSSSRGQYPRHARAQPSRRRKKSCHVLALYY